MGLVWAVGWVLWLGLSVTLLLLALMLTWHARTRWTEPTRSWSCYLVTGLAILATLAWLYVLLTPPRIISSKAAAALGRSKPSPIRRTGVEPLTAIGRS
jgi:hypothetical protein